MPENPPQYEDESDGEAKLLSFVVHLWQEEAASEEHQATWRGSITPVPDGKRRYFTNVNEIPDLIAAHLAMQK